MARTPARGPAWLAAVALLALCAGPAAAELRTRTVEYRDGDVDLRGHLAWDDAHEGRRPGVLVVHEWWGLDDYARGRAEDLAKLGYVGFALDMYGEGRSTEHPAEAREWTQRIQRDLEGWRRRAEAGLEALRTQPQVDPSRVAAIGYCFGGTTVFQLAYGGADLAGVASFHGSLPVPSAEEARRTRASILACHGSEDDFVPAERVRRFQEALDAADRDWTLAIYSGAEHSFTNPGADAHGMEGVSYDARADARSWAHLRIFLREVLGGPDAEAEGGGP